MVVGGGREGGGVGQMDGICSSAGACCCAPASVHDRDEHVGLQPSVSIIERQDLNKADDDKRWTRKTVSHQAQRGSYSR